MKPDVTEKNPKFIRPFSVSSDRTNLLLLKISEIEWALHTFLALSYSRYCLWEDMDRPHVKQKVIKKYALHGIWVELGIWRIATFVSSSLKTNKNGILLIKKLKLPWQNKISKAGLNIFFWKKVRNSFCKTISN